MATKTKTKKLKTSFTNTKGQKVKVYTDGTKTYSGGNTGSTSSSGGGGSSPTLTKEQADSMTKQLQEATRILNGIQNGQANTAPATTPTPVNTPAEVADGAGSAGGAGGSFVYDYSMTGGDPIINRLREEAGDDAGMEIDEDKIRRDVLKRYRSEIDATNNIYNDLVNRQEFTNENAEGSLRAMQNRQGLIGSGMGMSQTNQTIDAGNQKVGAINSERQVKISNIQALARQEAMDEITAKRTAKASGATAYLKYVEDEDARKAKRVSSVVSALITQGIDPAQMSEAELKEIAKNLGVVPQDITEQYVKDTADVRAKEQASTREGAIVSLIKQGVSDPKELYDLINYDDSGKKIGDITLKEINDVITGVTKKEEGFALGEGQARYVKQPDGSYLRVAYNPKTYKPEDSDTDPTNNTDIPTFEEYVKIREEEQQMNFAPHYRDKEIRAEYDAKYGSGSTAMVDIGKLTPTSKNELKQAGLSTADPVTQTYFLNTDPSFRDFFTRGVASGDFSASASLEDVDKIYEEWYNAKESGSSDDPFAGKSTAELLEMLNNQ